jgi:hypothetical protein
MVVVLNFCSNSSSSSSNRWFQRKQKKTSSSNSHQHQNHHHHRYYCNNTSSSSSSSSASPFEDERSFTTFRGKNKKTQEEIQAPLIDVTKRQRITNNREGDCLSCGRTDSHRWYKKRSQCHNCYNRARRILNRTDETRNQCSFCETRLTSEWYHDKFSEDGSLLKTGRRRMLCHSCYNAALAKSQDKQCDECKSTETGGSWYTGQGAAGGGRGICLCNMCYRRKLALFNKSDDLDDSVTQDGVSKKQYFCGQCGKMSFKLGTTAETGALVKSQVHENMRICRACYDRELNQRKLDGLPVKGARPQDLKRENFLSTNPFDII